MMLIKHLKIPDNLPHPKAIESFDDNNNSYDPESWELQYQMYRYLKNLPSDTLNERYLAILKNMRSIVCRDRDIIPIQSFLSSWYWFRKEHQTRLEFYLRREAPDASVPMDENFNFLARGAPIRPKHPNAGDVLFRYDQKIHLNKIVSEGSIRIRPASAFYPIENDEARQDQELSKRTFLPGGYTKVTTMDGKKIQVIGDIQRDVGIPDYYVFCMVCDWDPGLISDFKGSDSCLVIRDTETFSIKMESAGKKLLPRWVFYHSPVEYFDPYEGTKNEYIDPTMSKDFKFAYQKEYRFLWFSQIGEEADEFRFLELGDLGDISEVYT